MPQYHAQRKHIIHSFDVLCYQLHTISFFLSPTLWIYITRCAIQISFSRPRDIDPNRTLGRWLFMVVLFNFASIYVHAVYGAVEGFTIVLDFIGMAYRPSRFHLLCLDLAIITLQAIVTCISYETSLSCIPGSAQDMLLLEARTADSDIAENDENPKQKADSPYVIDLRLRAILDRMRHPPPPRDRNIPLPNVTPSQVTAALSLMTRGQQRRLQAARERIQRERRDATPRNLPGTLEFGNI